MDLTTVKFFLGNFFIKSSNSLSAFCCGQINFKENNIYKLIGCGFTASGTPNIVFKSLNKIDIDDFNSKRILAGIYIKNEALDLYWLKKITNEDYQNELNKDNKLYLKNDKIINSLKNPLTKSSLRFRKIHHIDNKTIKVSYFGHEIGGSYVSESSVTPTYIRDLEYSTNREVNFENINSGEGGFGSDVYYFTIYIGKVVNKNKYEPIGTLLRIKDCYFAFISECGYSWAFLNLLHTNINNIPKNIGIEIKNNNMFIDNKLIAKIVEYEEKTNHHFYGHNTGCSRTRFSATYDLLFSDNELQNLFFKKYLEIINFYLKSFNSKLQCIGLNLKYRQDQTTTIKIYFNDETKNFDLGSSWFVVSEKYIAKLVE